MDKTKNMSDSANLEEEEEDDEDEEESEDLEEEDDDEDDEDDNDEEEDCCTSADGDDDEAILSVPGRQAVQRLARARCVSLSSALSEFDLAEVAVPAATVARVGRGKAPGAARHPALAGPRIEVRGGVVGPLRLRATVAQVQREAAQIAAATAEARRRVATEGPALEEALLARRMAARLRDRMLRNTASIRAPPTSLELLAECVRDAPRASWPAPRLWAHLHQRMQSNWGT